MNKALMLVALATTACTADLRDASLTDRRPTADATTRGRLLLDRAARAHGVAEWREHTTLEVTFRDDWESTLAAMFGLEPWDEEDLVRMRLVRGTFDGRVDFVAGPRAGEAWGLDDGTHWVQAPSGRVECSPDEGEGFALRALAYLFELPFRLPDASTVVYQGEAEFEGRRYDRVLATWGSLAPNEHDQYRVWIDRETGRVGLVDFTVREQGDAFTSRALYGDYRSAVGVLVPHRLTVTDVGAGSKDDYLHQLIVRDAGFDRFAVAAVQPDRALARHYHASGAGGPVESAVVTRGGDADASLLFEAMSR